MERWEGKVAIVTGASSGIGEALVRDLVAHGLKVAALARRVDRLKNLESELKGSKGEVRGVECDVTKEEDVIRAFKFVEDTWGALHILVNNAGVLRLGPTYKMETEKVAQQFNTNVVGLTTCTREGLKLMTSHSITEGHIININSIVGHTIIPTFGAYCASKHAVTVLTEVLREEVANLKELIRVTSISPGLVETEMSALVTAECNNKLPALHPSAISQAALYVLSAPPIVNVAELIIKPSRESVHAFH